MNKVQLPSTTLRPGTKINYNKTLTLIIWSNIPHSWSHFSKILSCRCCTECGLSEYKAIEGVITSPGYPDLYPNDLKCVYHISSLESSFADSTVTIIFDELDTEFHQRCDYDFILVSCSKLSLQWLRRSQRDFYDRCKFEPIRTTNRTLTFLM